MHTAYTSWAAGALADPLLQTVVLLYAGVALACRVSPSMRRVVRTVLDQLIFIMCWWRCEEPAVGSLRGGHAEVRAALLHARRLEQAHQLAPSVLPEPDACVTLDEARQLLHDVTQRIRTRQLVQHLQLGGTVLEMIDSQVLGGMLRMHGFAARWHEALDEQAAAIQRFRYSDDDDDDDDLLDAPCATLWTRLDRSAVQFLLVLYARVALMVVFKNFLTRREAPSAGVDMRDLMRNILAANAVPVQAPSPVPAPSAGVDMRNVIRDMFVAGAVPVHAPNPVQAPPPVVAAYPDPNGSTWSDDAALRVHAAKE